MSSNAALRSRRKRGPIAGMKRLITFLVAILLTFPLVAATKSVRHYKSGNDLEVRRLASQPGRLAKIMAEYDTWRNGVSASALTDVRSARLLLFPAAGNARGAGGEFFRSDVTLISYADVDQDVVVVWMANGVRTEDPPAIELTLEANAYYTFTDFVGETLGQRNQLGSILVVPIDAAGDIEFAGAALDGYSRIWTNQPNATGTVAQPFEPLDPYSLYAFTTGSIMGLRQDAQYRSNFGIANIDDIDHTFVVRFLSETVQNELTVTVPAGGMIHRAVPAGNYGHLVIEVDVDDETAPWAAYGTSNDNITGDGWVSIASGILTPEDLDDVDGGF